MLEKLAKLTDFCSQLTIIVLGRLDLGMSVFTVLGDTVESIRKKHSSLRSLTDSYDLLE
jgi:hypothetical protein